mgnify:CR=1 FL=1
MEQANDCIFEKLLNLPLFQGITKDTLSTLVEKFPFHFLKYNIGETIIKAGEKCTHIRFVVSGSVSITISSPQTKVVLRQILDSPEVIAPDYLFGRSTDYPCMVKAANTCGVLQIKKTDYIAMLQSERVLLFNILNYLSRNSQNRLWTFTSKAGGKFTIRLALMIFELTTRKSREINLTFKQKDLCALLGVRRTTLIMSLEELKRNKIISYSQNGITVLDRRGLIDIIHG